jgi:hypothetical protein
MKIKPISLILVLFFISLSGVTFGQSDLAKQYHNPLGSLKALHNHSSEGNFDSCFKQSLT